MPTVRLPLPSRSPNPSSSPAPSHPSLAAYPRHSPRRRGTFLALASLVLALLVAGAGLGRLSPAPAAAAASYFGTLPPGTTLPTEADCAARVRRNGWEPRPANTAKNGAVDIRLTRLTADPDNRRPDFAQRVNGNFAGTTDELRQFYACKWGLDEVHLGAVMHLESEWKQDMLGDYRALANNPACRPGYMTDPCPESFGITQLRTHYYAGTWPGAITSTAFNLDHYGASQRACFEGLTTWLASSRRGAEYGPGNLMGCAGWWYNGGSWMLEETSGDYRRKVQARIDSPPWHTWAGWPGYAAGAPTSPPSLPPASKPNPSPSPSPSASVASGRLVVATPLSVDVATAQSGQRVTGRVTWRNAGDRPLELRDAVITMRPPGATNAGGPYHDFAPRLGARTLAPGESVTLLASFTVPTDATPGMWRAFAATNDGVWRDTPADQDVSLSVPPSAFPDVRADAPEAVAIRELAARGIIRGYTDGRFGPDDTVLRAQMAGLIARSMGWDAADHGNPFTDRNGLDVGLWRNVGTLAHHGVAKGYGDGTFGPSRRVTRAETLAFITRAMIAGGHWTPVAPSSAPSHGPFAKEHATYLAYVGALPASNGGLDQPATRAWFALALWSAFQTADAAP